MSIPKYILGIDGGASYSRGVIFTDDGQTIATEISEGMNLSIYRSIASKRIRDMINKLLSNADIDINDLFSIGLGLAAASDQDGRDLVFRELDGLGVSTKSIIINDAEASYSINCPSKSGVLVTVGTGVICIGVDDAGKTYRSAGKGHYAGDIGSGFWIGQQSIMKLGLNESAVKADNNLSEIMDIVLKKFNNENFSIAIEEVMESGESVKLIASLAKDIIELAALDNSIALSIIQEGTISVSEYIVDVLNDMGLKSESIILAGNGSVIRNDFYRKNLNNALMFDIPDLAWTFSDLSAAYGAGIIAAKSKNVDIKISKILSGNPLYATCS